MNLQRWLMFVIAMIFSFKSNQSAHSQSIDISTIKSSSQYLQFWDVNGDEQIDTYELEGIRAATRADINGDGIIDGADAAQLYADWGAVTQTSPTSERSDQDGDGLVDASDWGTMASFWSSPAPACHVTSNEKARDYRPNVPMPDNCVQWDFDGTAAWLYGWRTASDRAKGKACREDFCKEANEGCPLTDVQRLSIASNCSLSLDYIRTEEDLVRCVHFKVKAALRAILPKSDRKDPGFPVCRHYAMCAVHIINTLNEIQEEAVVEVGFPPDGPFSVYGHAWAEVKVDTDGDTEIDGTMIFDALNGTGFTCH